MIQQIIQIVKSTRLPLTNEIETQKALAAAFTQAGIDFKKEYWLNDKDKPDFFIHDIAIEVKIKGTARNIYMQLERYSKSDEVKQLLLITGKAMGIPSQINGKPCYLVNISSAWL